MKILTPPVLISFFWVFLLIQTTPAMADKAITYKPPQMGAPATRIGGGSRGDSDNEAQVQVLAPEQTGLTSQASPTLYWSISKASPATVEITLNQGEAEPLLEKKLSGIQNPGIQAISLKDSGIKLQPGQEYTFTVALVIKPNQRSSDIVSSTTLKYQIPSKPYTDVAEMAEAGYWYDALDKLVTTQSPQLASLLKQVGIDL